MTKHRVWMMTAGRWFVLALVAAALTQQTAFAASPGASPVLEAIGKKVFEALAQLAGIVATIGGVVVGIRVVYGAMMGSPRTISEGITALIGVSFGIGLIASGPQLARYIYDAL